MQLYFEGPSAEVAEGNVSPSKDTVSSSHFSRQRKRKSHSQDEDESDSTSRIEEDEEIIDLTDDMEPSSSPTQSLPFPNLHISPARPINASRYQSTPGSSMPRSDQRAANLEAMFKRPSQIMFHGSLDQAKRQGTLSKRWILLDLHDTSQFVCACLNRDIYSDQTVQDFIRENLLFLQVSTNDVHGNNYHSLYPVPTFETNHGETLPRMPHLAMLDPRTGERVKLWCGRPFKEPVEFLQEIGDFLDAHSLESKAAVPKASPSLTASNTTVAPHDLPQQIIPMNFAEPDASVPSTDITKLMFRFSDGSRIVHKFLKRSTTIMNLFSFVSFKKPSLGSSFDLAVSPHTAIPSLRRSSAETSSQFLSLKNCLDDTLSKAGIIDVVIIVVNDSK